ncbi:hypothetical protein ASPWEDRAFT_151732, partial [Aspergillus wentii DTO 134E9]
MANSNEGRHTIHGLFTAMASCHPNAAAIEFESSVAVSYHDLSRQSDRLAAVLAPIIEHGQLVPVLLPRCPLQITVILALSRLGAVYVPLDPHLPSERLHAMLTRLDPPVVMTNVVPSTPASWYEAFERCVVDPSSCMKTEGSDGQPPRRTVNADDIAAILFTSGSTGLPKGVLLTHRNLIDPVVALGRLESMAAGSRIFQFASCSFDVHMIDILGALIHGACICQVSQEKMLDRLSDWIQTMQADTIHLTPTVLATMKPEEVPSLRYVVTCGEPVSAEVVSAWAPRVVLRNLYGPCEASSIVSQPLSPNVALANVGQASPHARITILDPISRQPVAAGHPGEIFAAGTSVAAGYWQDPENTARSFFVQQHESQGFTLTPTCQPKAGEPAWYATGDLGYLAVNGDLYLMGRADRQVKVNGQRVELGEIEKSTVDQSLLPTQGQGVLIVGTHHSGEGAVLVAFVGERESSSEEKSPRVLPLDNQSRIKQLNILRDRVSDALPAAMVPRYWIPISPMPRGVTGKANRPLLKQWFGDLQQTDTAEQYASLVSRECEHPQDRTSSLMDSLRECWATVLPAAAGVSADSSFFKTGGDSITAIRFCSQARHRGVQGCSVRLMMAHPTLAGLTRVLTPLQMETKGEESRIATATVTKESSVEQAREDPMDWLRRHYPGYNESMPKRLLDAVNAQCHDQESNAVDKIYSPSAMQQTMLAQSLIDPELYATQLLLRFTGPLDVARLQDAWTSVCQAHPSLRTCYISLSNGPLEFFAVERRSASSTTHFWVTERVPLTDDELEKELLTIRKSALSIYQRTSALTIFSLATEEHLAVLTCHHAVVDGWSLKQLLSDFANAYQNQQPLDPGHSFSIFSAALQSRDNSKAVEFWSQYVAGGQSASLVQDGGCQAVSGQRRSCQLEHRLSCSTAQALRDAAMQHGTTPAILFQAALGVSLARLTGTTTPLFWVTSNGRDPDIPDALSTIGNFINAVPCLVPTSKNCSVRRLLHYLHRISGQAASHSWLPASSILPSLPDDSQVIDTILILENH